MTSIDSLAKENTCFTKIISSLYENFKDAWGQDWAGNSSFSEFCPNSILLRDKYERQETCSRSRLFPRPSGRSKILPTQISHGQTAPFNRAGPRCEIKNKNLLRVCTKYSPFWLTVKLKVATLHWKSALNTIYLCMFLGNVSLCCEGKPEAIWFYHCYLLSQHNRPISI